MALTFLDPIIVNTAATFTFANIAVTSNVTAGSLKTDNLLYANGQPFAFPTVPGGSNTQIQFNDAGSLGGNPNFTFSKASNTLSVSSIVASGVGLSNLPGANVSGQVANALIAGTVYTNAQPNITSVGTLTVLTVTGNITSGNAALGNLVTANFFSGSGNLLSNIQGSNITGPVSFATTANAVAGANVSGAVGLATFATTANAVAGANVSGQVANALITGTVYTNAQPNITSIGTLSSLTVSGNISAGNINANNAVVASTLTSNAPTGTAPLTITSTTRVTNLNVAYANVADFLNVTAPGTGTGYLIFANATTGNVTEWTSSGISSNLANNSITATTFVGALSGAATTAGTVTTAAQSNITSVGTLTSLGVTGTVTAAAFTANTGVFTGNGSGLSSIAGSNVSGQVGNALIASTVYTNAQPNITSVGILTSLAVTGNTTSSNFVGTLNGSGANVISINATNISSGTLAQARLANSAVTLGSTALTLGSTVTTINGLVSVTSTSFVGSLTGAATTAGTVTIADQPNITSVGTLTALTMGGNLLVQQTQEKYVTLTGSTGIVTHNFALGGTFYHSGILGNFTANITNLPSLTGQATVIALMLVQGATPYICNGLNIAGAAQTIRWLGGTAPVGTGTKHEAQLFTIFQTGASAYTVTGQLNSYG